MAKEDAQEEVTEENIRSTFAALGRQEMATTTHTRVVKPKHEGTMAGLLRILGPYVRDVFPKELTDAVDASFAYHKANPDEYLITPFDTVDDMNDSLFVMRAYAECAPDGGYSIRTIDHDAAPELHWRAQTRATRKFDK